MEYGYHRYPDKYLSGFCIPKKQKNAVFLVILEFIYAKHFVA